MSVVLDATRMSVASVFKNEAALAFRHHPREIPARETELQWLAEVLEPLVVSNVPRHAMIYGPVGSGKTLVAREAGRRARSRARELGKRSLVVVEVNCRLRTSEADVLHAIVSALDPRFPDRGFSRSEVMTNILARLRRQNANLLLILDEAQCLYGDDPGRAATDTKTRAYGNSGPKSNASAATAARVPYLFTRMGDDAQADEPVCCVLLVSQGDARDQMDEATRSTFGDALTLRLDAYTLDELSLIIAARAREAIAAGHLTPDELDMAADAGHARRDVRAAIEALHVRARNKAVQLVTEARPITLRSSTPSRETCAIEPLPARRPPARQAHKVAALLEALQHGPLTLHELAAATRSAYQNVATRVTRLQDDGHVLRTNPGERPHKYALTTTVTPPRSQVAPVARHDRRRR